MGETMEGEPGIGAERSLFLSAHLHVTRHDHCCGQNILHVTQMGCKTTNFTCFHGNTANKGFCSVQIDLQNAVIIFVVCFATLQNKLATAVDGNPRLSYISKREGCCELQTGLHPPNDLLSVRKCRKRPCTRSFPGNIHSKLDVSV